MQHNMVEKSRFAALSHGGAVGNGVKPPSETPAMWSRGKKAGYKQESHGNQSSPEQTALPTR